MALKQNYKLILIYKNDKVANDGIFKSVFEDVPSEMEQTKIIENAYLMINRLIGDKNKVTFELEVYKDNTKSFLVESKHYSFVPSVDDNAPNFIKQGYEYLKTLDEFAGAVDILEDGQVT